MNWGVLGPLWSYKIVPLTLRPKLAKLRHLNIEKVTSELTLKQSEKVGFQLTQTKCN